jgi:predicted dehydrogenase
VHQVRVWNHVNDMPDGIGAEPDSPAPGGLDWDFWLGPAPLVPFNRKRFLGTFRAFSDYAGGRITDFGIHRFDSVHQILGADAPRSVAAAGGRFALGGLGDHPDLLIVTYEYPGFVLVYETSSINSFGAVGRITPGRAYYGAGAGESRPNGMAFHGSNGTLLVDRTGWELIPDEPARRRAGGGGSAERDRRLGPALERAHGNAADATALHARHFVACVRGEETPRADALVGHRSTTVAHLGNIAYRTGRKLVWDAAREDFDGAPDAAALLARAARKPWDLIES